MWTEIQNPKQYGQLRISTNNQMIELEVDTDVPDQAGADSGVPGQTGIRHSQARPDRRGQSIWQGGADKLFGSQSK